MAALLVIALRLVLPLGILRWPLAGGILALVVDAIDVVLVYLFAKVLSDPKASPVVLSDRVATRGMISDRGLLAVAAADAVGRLCLVDAAGLLP